MLSNSKTGTQNILWIIYSQYFTGVWGFFASHSPRYWPGQSSLCVLETNKSSDRQAEISYFMSGAGHRVSLWSVLGGCWLPWSLKPTEEMTVPSVISITVRMYTHCTVHRSPQDTIEALLYSFQRALYITKAHQEVSQASLNHNKSPAASKEPLFYFIDLLWIFVTINWMKCQPMCTDLLWGQSGRIEG